MYLDPETSFEIVLYGVCTIGEIGNGSVRIVLCKNYKLYMCANYKGDPSG